MNTAAYLLALASPLLSVTALAGTKAATSPRIIDPPAAVHGMVLFGSDVIYASHIPMYHAPHDWQALFQVTLTHPTVDAKALYLHQIASGVQPLITIKPLPFVLPKLLNGEVHSFAASLYHGNFEEDSEELMQGMTVTVKTVLFKQHLSLDMAALPQLTYFLIPTSLTTAMLVHRISAPDNFDQIVQVKAVAVPLPTTPAGTVSTVVFPGVSDTAAARLRAGDAIELTRTAEGWSATISAGSSPSAAALNVVEDFYCTPGPDFYGACGVGT